MNNLNNDSNKSIKLWSIDFTFLMIANFFLFFGDNLLLPVLPVYVKQNGANNFQVGVVAAVFFATSVLMRIFTSRASARFGKRTILLLSITVFALAMMGYYLFAGLTMILILRLVQGVGFGSSTTLYATTAANIIPSKKMGEGMGYFGLGVSIAAVLGPCLGAVAVSLTHFKWVFLVAALLEVISILLTLFIKVDNSINNNQKKTGIKNFLSDIIEPKVIYEAIFMLLIGLVMGGFSTYIVLFAKQMNIKNIFIYFIVVSASEIFVRMFSGKLYDRKGLNIVVIPGAIAGIIGCIIIASATNLWMVCIFAFLYGIAIGVIFPVMEASAMKSAEPERRVAANATLYNFLDIGMGLGPLLFGAGIQLFSYSTMFFFSSLFFATMLVIIAFSAIVKKRKKEVEIN